MVADKNTNRLRALGTEIGECRACPRLVEWREHVAVEKRASFRDDKYFGAGVGGFGDPKARIVVVGLAPAAHGANRTGRIFTGDRSGDFLFGSMHRCGLANQAASVSLNDGLRLNDAYVLAAVRCAPPGNKPAPAERDNCASFMVRELGLLSNASVLVGLGRFACDAIWSTLRANGVELPRKRNKFAHLMEQSAGPFTLVASFHPSQQNTFTGRLTEPMLDAVFDRAIQLANATDSAKK